MHGRCLKVNTESTWKLMNGYWVAPVVMVKETVMCGSDGCLLWPAETIKAMAAKWHDVPVSLDHPTIDGSSVSINKSREVYARHAIGFVQSPIYDPVAKALKATIIIPEGVKGIDRIRQLKEVSIGVFTTNVQGEGKYQGRNYIGHVAQAVPDHLALLSEGQGSCSWARGCGVRAYSANVDPDTRNEMLAVFADALGGHVRKIFGLGGCMKMEEGLFPHGVVVHEDDNKILDNWEQSDKLAPPEINALRRTQKAGDEATDKLLPPGVE